MPKQFYTEKDIEDLFSSGIKSLKVGDDVVLTELAYEKAKRLGLQLVTDRAENPPAAPVRPYLSEGSATARVKPSTSPVSQATSPSAPASTAFSQQTSSLSSAREDAIEQRIRSAVIAKLGNQVDAKLLDNVIHRVVKGIGLK
jgi:hypothetical protein